MKLPLPAIVVTGLLLSPGTVAAQSSGIELLNNVMPASAGMAGASTALPQDVQSAVYGNPATMTQFHGTQVSFGGAWIEPTYKVGVDPPGVPLLFNVDPFPLTKSDAQGVAAGNIGITQDFSALGKPITAGIGLFAGAGAGVDFRQVPESNGTHANIAALDIVAGAGADLTESVSVGGSITISNATLDGPFVGVTGSSSDYALRGTIGVDYELAPQTTIGGYWKSETRYTFENLAGFVTGTYLDVRVDRPEIVGLGLANRSLMNGRLLLAMDAVYLNYSDTALFGAFYTDQWALQFGSQYEVNDRVKVRLGYAWNENPMRDVVSDRAGGISPPGGANHIQYIQALFATIPQHRVTAGIGVVDVLPGVDVNLFAGGMFEDSQTFGVTTASVSSYWVGTGITWRFGRGACEAGPWR